MSNLVIVAIPDENDRVWKLSSEKIPHLTLLFLGDADAVANSDQIVQFVEHAANTTLKRFYLPVDHRGELGEDKADVLFFKQGRYDFKAIHDFRSQLLKDDNIKTAYDSTTQHEGPWKPHLTLGYPETPAKSENEDWGSIYSVDFNKIAVWFGDYEGPDFLLKDYWDEFESLQTVPVDVAMSGIMIHGADEYEQNLAMGEAFLAHYGVKGMKWGVRNDKPETKVSRWDPQGHSLAGDVAKGYLLAPIPVVQLLSVPANVRLTRGAYRGGKAYGEHVSEKRAEKKAGKQAAKDAKNDANFEKVARSQEGFAAIHNGSVDKMNSGVKKINERYSEADLKVPAKQKKYDAEVLKLMQDSYRESANSIGNKRGTKHLDVEFKNDGMDFTIKVKEGPQTPTVERVKHAAIDDDDVVTFMGKIKRAPTGHIVGFEFDDFDQPDVIHMLDAGTEFLEHFGVKGMHWGVRKSDIGSAAKSAGGAVGKAAGATSRFVQDVHFESKTKPRTDEYGGQSDSPAKEAIIGAASKPFKKEDLPALKERHGDYAKLTKRVMKPLSKEARAYRKDARETYVKRLETEANKMKNASGNRQYTIRERGIDLPSQGGNLPRSKYAWEVSSREVKHAATVPDFTLEVIMDDEGWITDVVPIETELAQSDLDVTEVGEAFVIEHFGVKGMKWGVRRGAPEAVGATAASHVPHGNRRKTKVKVEGGQNHPASDDALKVAEVRTKLAKSGVSTLSNKELQDLNKRLQLETQAAQLTSSRGQKFITRQLEQTGQQTFQYGVRTHGPKVAKKAGKKAGKTAAKLAIGAVLL